VKKCNLLAYHLEDLRLPQVGNPWPNVSADTANTKLFLAYSRSTGHSHQTHPHFQAHQLPLFGIMPIMTS